MKNNKFETTFWSDYTIAECFGNKAIYETYNRTFNEWKNNLVYITELVIVLNWKCWNWYERKNITRSKIYAELYEKTHDWCLDNLKGKDLEYYLRQVD